jgi:eukaryotic-like serine/threonine-protein kinase
MAFDPTRAKALFNAALDLPGPAERPAFLDRECGDDQELRHRLEELLAAHDRPASALERPMADPVQAGATGPGVEPSPTVAMSGLPADGPAPTASFGRQAGPPGSLIGTVIAGRYKVRQEIGEGGMGSVYLAEQLQPVRRMVALKLIKPGMDSRTVLARFDSERQALALMDHPNIARVLDAGSTEGGRPFFVMELVKGIPVTEYCDRHRLDLPERLTLFRQICSAVQHAHQKGIIHRDLKPTNILVESHDGKPVPKVIDFGLAKATSGLKLTEQSLFTAFGGVAGTPLYMAPEQASFNALDVDTRADIYALGVILYELLTGSTPIRRETFHSAALDEMLRVIREDEPPTPSSRLSTSDALASLAATRHIEPTRLSRFMRGDLDWIVMKALAKERQRRYDSAIGLANDLERFANNEPVNAGPPSSSYRLRKFVRRNRPQVVAASLVLLALVAGVVGTTLGLIEARKQQRIAVAEAAEKEKARLSEALQRQRAEKRLAQIEKANEILGSIFKDLDPTNADSGGKPLAVLLAEQLDRAAAQIEGEAIGDLLTVARMQQTLGRSQYGLGYAEKAIGLYAKARATFAAELGPDHPDTLESMNILAEGYRVVGQLDRALPLFEETLALRRAKLGLDHPDTLATMNDLAVGYQADARFDRALPLFEETLALRRAKLGLDHRDTLGSMNGLADGYRAAGQLDRALPLLEEAVSLRRAKLGPDDFYTLASMNNLALGYQAAGRFDRALPLLEETLAHVKAKLGPHHPHTLSYMNNLAVGYQAAGQVDRAMSLLGELVVLWKQRAGTDSTPYAGALASLGLALLREEKWAEAESNLRGALTIREREEPDLWSTFHIRSMLGGALLGRKRHAEAEPLLRAGYEGMKQRADKIPPQGKIRLAEALDRLIELAEATDTPDDARKWKDEKAKLPTPPLDGKKL